MRALVTGAAGFIGSHLARRLLDDGHEARLVDAFTDAYDPEVKRARARALQDAYPGLEIVEADLRAADLAPLTDGIEVVFHLAAQPGVRSSWGAGFADYVTHNVLATQRLLEASAGRPLARFVYASSSSIYGEAERHPTREDAVPAPVSPYGVTKLGGEHLAEAYRRSAGVPTVRLRYFSVYGPGQRPDMGFHRFIRALLEGRPIEVFGDGEQTRDVTYVSDAVEATLAAATAPQAIGEAINVGGGTVTTVNAAIRVLAEVAGREVEVQHGDRQPGDARHTSADLGKARDLLAYAPSTSLEEGLRAEWAWLAERAPAV